MTIHILNSDTALPHFVKDVEEPLNLYHSVTGLRFEQLPVLMEKENQPELSKSIRADFNDFAKVFLQTLHSLAINEADVYPALAWQVNSEPRKSFGSKLNFYFLIGAAGKDPHLPGAWLKNMLPQLQASFPKNIKNKLYPRSYCMSRDELAGALYHGAELKTVTVSKHLERFEGETVPRSPLSTVTFPHPIFTYPSALTELFGLLEQSREPVSVRIEMEPIFLSRREREIMRSSRDACRKAIREADRLDDLINEKASRDNFAGSSTEFRPKTYAENLAERRILDASLSPEEIEFARRGNKIFTSFYLQSNRLFTFKARLASPVSVSGILLNRLIAILSDVSKSNLIDEEQNPPGGWDLPEIYSPDSISEKKAAAGSFQWLGQHPRDLSGSKYKHQAMTTIDEVANVFQLPLVNSNFSGFSTRSTPFLVPFETANTIDQIPSSPQVKVGYLYDQEEYFGPHNARIEQELPFRIPIQGLTQPTVISGSPGSGKTNQLMALLIELYENRRLSFCVLDPSNGLEYRYLLSQPSLADKLVVYTVGDNSTNPLRFNMFSIPPSGKNSNLNVKTHISRLLSAFKAASEFFDPLGAIFREALERTYTDFGWTLDDTYETGLARLLKFPCLSDFYEVIQTTLVEDFLPKWGEGTEAAGVLRGGTEVRVKDILNQCGSILDVRGDSADFFQNLLKTPTVIELGALGSEDTISLVMSFLVVQFTGHTEYAQRSIYTTELRHILAIDEAHILLAEDGNKSGSTLTGNTRGKTSGDISRMLAELRKFGCGVVLLDQRFGSLIGGAIDNAYTVILLRTAERKSLEHFAKVLGLSEEQIKYAETQLDQGQAIMWDRYSSKPVLVKAALVIDELRKNQLSSEQFVIQIRSNAEAAGLITPEPASSRHRRIQVR